ncbi:MAG TPA: hypothetical protein VJT72_08880, partial [Pseudonocardiaceae bacterium]|nr:hypothetical protein [Pseudonocardiaceae bacterium]
YQPGRRDDVLDAFVKSLYLDRECAEAWCELVDYASYVPHVPTFTHLLARCPIACRAPLLHRLLAVSFQKDQAGKMSPAAGERLRAAMLDLVDAEGDYPSITLLNNFLRRST